ncbi:MAG: L,D-transpeptidase family protein [Phycisphaerae bacterium]
MRPEAPIETGSAPPDPVWTRLKAAGWTARVGDGLGLWVSVARQRLVGIERGRVRFVYRCSTAAKGTGNREHSHQTPLGWHAVAERFGGDLPRGAVLVGRKPTGAVWHPGDRTEKDLVLSRILWLKGLEPGLNQGAGVDSHDRYIYIHGTPAEEKLGSPASMGCIRLSNDDVIALYPIARTGVPVLITEW